MITTVTIDGERRVAIALKYFNEADMPDFAKSMIDVLALAFTSDDAKDFIDSCSLYHVLELFKAITEPQFKDRR